jgi:hypothetical protein
VEEEVFRMADLVEEPTEQLADLELLGKATTVLELQLTYIAAAGAELDLLEFLQTEQVEVVEVQG